MTFVPTVSDSSSNFSFNAHKASSYMITGSLSPSITMYLIDIPLLFRFPNHLSVFLFSYSITFDPSLRSLPPCVHLRDIRSNFRLPSSHLLPSFTIHYLYTSLSPWDRHSVPVLLSPIMCGHITI